MTGYLLDSHVVVWLVLKDARLSRSARDVIEGSRRVCVSAGSLWELSLKESRGKLFLPGLEDLLETYGIEELPVRWREARIAAKLPPHHGDPFDRILVAQALAEDLVLVTADRDLARYPVRTLF